MWDDLIVFAVFAAIAGIQLLVRFIQAQKNRADQAPRTAGRPEPAQPAPRRVQPVYDEEEERMRKFLEALGIPTDDAPPPPVPRRETPEPPPLFEPSPAPEEPVFRKPELVTPPPLPSREERPAARPKRRHQPPPIVQEVEGPKHRMADAIFREGDLKDAPQPMSAAAAFREMPQPQTSASAYEIKRTPKNTRSHSGVRALLANRRTLRDAIILREVLGPPKALQ